MPDLKGTKTHDNLKEAFAGESQANRRYLYFAQKADVEGYPDVAALFRSVAEGETGHAFGHFDFLAEVGDPATGEPVGTEAIAGVSLAQESQSALLLTTCVLRLRARHTSTHRCTRVSPRQLAMKASKRLLSGWRRLHAPRRATLTVT